MPGQLIALVRTGQIGRDCAPSLTISHVVAEKIADDAAGTRPAWTKRVPALTEIWESFGTPRMRAQAEATAPHQLALRNIYIPTTSLWRHSA